LAIILELADHLMGLLTWKVSSLVTFYQRLFLRIFYNTSVKTVYYVLSFDITRKHIFLYMRMPGEMFKVFIFVSPLILSINIDTCFVKRILIYWTDFYSMWFFLGLVWFLVFNATFNSISVISWRSVLLVEETGVLRVMVYTSSIVLPSYLEVRGQITKIIHWS
jgi:hypothetical protein